MALEKEVSKIDTEEFITEIEKSPAIWNSTSDEYSDRVVKRNAWSKVITHFFPDFEEKSAQDKKTLGTLIQRRWKSLRDGYTRENLKRKEEFKSGSAAKERKSYVYYEQLRFLEPIYKTTKSSMSDGKDDQEDTQSSFPLDTGIPEEMEQPQPKRCKTSTGTSSRKKEDPDELLLQALKAQFMQRSTEANDPDKLFLLSLLPDLKAVPDSMKIEAKTRLMGVFAQVRQEVQRLNAIQHQSHQQQHHLQQNYYGNSMPSRQGNHGRNFQTGSINRQMPGALNDFSSQPFPGGPAPPRVQIPGLSPNAGPISDHLLSPNGDTCFSSTSSELDFSEL